MAVALKSNVFSDVHITGNCIVTGTISSVAGSITSQWTTGGSSIYYNSGNVGIGVTNPINQFTVFNSSTSVSNVASGTASTAAYSTFVNTADNRRTFVGIDGTGLFAFSTGALALGTDNTPVIFAPNHPTGEKMRITPGGNVGIGTASPVSLLTVQGEARITGNLISAGFTSNSTNTVFNSDTLTVPFVSATQVLTSTLGTAITGTNLQITSNVDLSTGTMNVATVISSTGLMFRNRIINGDFRLDQRNAGASFTPTAVGITYTLDRWWGWVAAASKFSVQQSAIVPTGQGFTNSVLVTSLSAFSTPVGGYYGFGQYIEGYNIADMGFGTASATMATLSFWARSSIAGTFSVALENGGFNRSYVFNYTISSVNTWQYFTLPFRADTTGAWNSTNGRGLRIWWDLGSSDATYAGTAGSWLAADVLRTTGSVSLIGTNAATLYIAGAQVEKGSAATPFEFRPFAIELALCQRYFQILNSAGGQNYYAGLTGGVNGFTCSIVTFKLTTAMRITPTQYWYTDLIPQLTTVAGGTATLNYVGNTTTAGVSIPGLSPASAAYGVDSSTNTTMITLLPCATALASPGANVPLFVRSVHIDFISEL